MVPGVGADQPASIAIEFFEGRHVKRNSRTELMADQDESRLVEQARTGDEGAFGELMQMYHARVLGVARGIVGNAEDAQDLAQQAWIKAWRNLGSFSGRSKFYTWLYRIVTFTCIDFLRKKKSTPVSTARESDAAELGDTYGVAAPASERPDRSAELSEIREQFTAAVEKLSPEHRTALVLREVEGLSYEEIAKAMSCRKGTVMSRLFHARRKIQAGMEELR